MSIEQIALNSEKHISGKLFLSYCNCTYVQVPYFCPIFLSYCNCTYVQVPYFCPTATVRTCRSHIFVILQLYVRAGPIFLSYCNCTYVQVPYFCPTATVRTCRSHIFVLLQLYVRAGPICVHVLQDNQMQAGCWMWGGRRWTKGCEDVPSAHGDTCH